MVGRALDVGLPAQRVHAAARHPHVAEQRLDDGHGADVLDADGVLGPAHGVHDGAGLALGAGGGIGLVDLQQVLLRGAGDLGDQPRGVAGVMGFQQLKHAAFVLKRQILLGNAVGVQLVGPLARVVGPLVRVEAGEQPVLEIESITDQEGGVRVADDVLLVVELVVDDVLDHAAQEGDVGPGAQGRVDVRLGGGPGKARVHADHLAAPVLGLGDVFHGNGVVLGSVAAHDQNDSRCS